LYRYFVSQSSEFGHYNPLCCFSTSNTKGKHIFLYRPSPETCGYTFVWYYEEIQNNIFDDLVNMVMNIRVPYKAGCSCTSCVIVSFSRKTLLHRVSSFSLLQKKFTVFRTHSPYTVSSCIFSLASCC